MKEAYLESYTVRKLRIGYLEQRAPCHLEKTKQSWAELVPSNTKGPLMRLLGLLEGRSTATLWAWASLRSFPIDRGAQDPAIICTILKVLQTLILSGDMIGEALVPRTVRISDRVTTRCQGRR